MTSKLLVITKRIAQEQMFSGQSKRELLCVLFGQRLSPSQLNITRSDKPCSITCKSSEGLQEVKDPSFPELFIYMSHAAASHIKTAFCSKGRKVIFWCRFQLQIWSSQFDRCSRSRMNVSVDFLPRNVTQAS